MLHVSWVISPWSLTSQLRTVVVPGLLLLVLQPASQKVREPAITAPIATHRHRVAPVPVTVMPLQRSVLPVVCTAPLATRKCR